MPPLLPGVPERAPLSSSSLASAWRNLLPAVAISSPGLPLRRDGPAPFHPGAPVLHCPQQGARSAPKQGEGLPGGRPWADESEATFSVISLHHRGDLLAPSAYLGLPYALCSEPGDKEEGGSRDPRPPEGPTRAPPFGAWCGFLSSVFSPSTSHLVFISILHRSIVCTEGPIGFRCTAGL